MSARASIPPKASKNCGAKEAAFIAERLAEFGSRMTGEQLWKALGYKSRRTFERAARAGRLGVPLYASIERRGRYAKTVDVARYVWKELTARNVV